MSWTDDERKMVKREIVGTFMYYGKSFEELAIQFHAQDLERSNFPAASILEAYSLYRSDPTNKTPPLPAQIIQKLKPSDDPESFAKIKAGEVIDAISRFGYTNSERAREHLGERVWAAVRAMGGWPALCEVKTSELGILRAQLRDAIIACEKTAPVKRENLELPNQVKDLIEMKGMN